jgi:AmmeMemoRadiSam system protein B
MIEGEWLTPFGTVPINNKLGEKLFKDIIDKDENAHMYEHSIEVQLPFLQFVASEKKFDFVPICMGMQDTETSIETGKIIADVIKESDRKVVIIASSDFSHAGFNYMSMPPEGMRVDEYADKQDHLAIGKILDLDPEGLINTVQQNNITMCGYGPVAAMITASKILGATKAELLKYGTSYEVQPSSSCVGYGAIAVY